MAKGHDYLGHYAVLGLTPAAKKSEIVKAWRELLRVLHPDKNQNRPPTVLLALQHVATQAKTAKDCLASTPQRTLYDEACLGACTQPLWDGWERVWTLNQGWSYFRHQNRHTQRAPPADY